LKYIFINEKFGSYSNYGSGKGFCFACFLLRVAESDSELLASNHSSSIAKRAEKGSRQNKTAYDSKILARKQMASKNF